MINIVRGESKNERWEELMAKIIRHPMVHHTGGVVGVKLELPNTGIYLDISKDLYNKTSEDIRKMCEGYKGSDILVDWDSHGFYYAKNRNIEGKSIEVDDENILKCLCVGEVLNKVHVEGVEVVDRIKLYEILKKLITASNYKYIDIKGIQKAKEEKEIDVTIHFSSKLKFINFIERYYKGRSKLIEVEIINVPKNYLKLEQLCSKLRKMDLSYLNSIEEFHCYLHSDIEDIEDYGFGYIKAIYKV